MTTMTMNRPENRRESVVHEDRTPLPDETIGGTEFNFDPSMLMDSREPGLEFGEYIAAASNCCQRPPPGTTCCCCRRAMSDEQSVVETVTLCIDRD